MLHCHGNDEHCCVFAGIDCPFIEDGMVTGRRWSCGLYRELQDWDMVLADPRYIEIVQPMYDSIGRPDWNCKDWPQNIPEVMAQPSGRCCWESDGNAT